MEKLFKSFEKTGPNARKTKARLVEGMIRELTVHASIEEQIFYPRVRQDAQDTVLIESVRHHVKEEEGSLFPAVRKAFGRPAQVAMGDALAAAKKGAPVKPRPRLPDVPR